MGVPLRAPLEIQLRPQPYFRSTFKRAPQTVRLTGYRAADGVENGVQARATCKREIALLKLALCPDCQLFRTFYSCGGNRNFVPSVPMEEL